MQHRAVENKEEKMIMLVKQNDQQSFFQFYDHYAPLISGIIKNTTDHKENAEKLLQDCFMQIWCNKNHFNPSKESMFSWIYKLTTQIALQSFPSSEGNKSFTPVQEEKIALELILIHGYSFHEIAGQMNLSAEFLRSKIRTALKTYQTSPPQ